MPFFQFKYLRNRKIYYYFFAITISIILLGVLYNYFKWKSIQRLLESGNQAQVNLYYTIKESDTTTLTTSIKDLKFKDSLLKYSQLESEGLPGLCNFPVFYMHKDTVFYFLNYTDDSLISKVAFISLERRQYEEFFVYSKSMHFKK